jgi:hypothetical protein
MYDDLQALTVEDFSRWLTAPQAISALSHLKMEDAARQIWKRVEHDIMKAVAARIVFPNGGQAERAIVPSKWWRLDAPLVKLGFWDTGDIELAESSGSYGLPDKPVAALFGVRFDPAGIAELVPSPSVAAADVPTAAEFQHWLNPDDARDRLPEDWGHGHCVDAIITSLRVGGITAVARRGLLKSDGEQQAVEFHTIAPEYWNEDGWVMGPEALWVTGQVSFHRGSRLAERLGQPPEEWIEHTFTGVRFDPVAFAREFAGHLRPEPKPDVAESPPAGDASAQAAPAPPPEKQPLSDSRLAAWAKLFVAAHPGASEKVAKQSLAELFPNNSVTRERLRTILPARQRGRPLKAKEEN